MIVDLLVPTVDEGGCMLALHEVEVASATFDETAAVDEARSPGASTSSYFPVQPGEELRRRVVRGKPHPQPSAGGIIQSNTPVIRPETVVPWRPVYGFHPSCAIKGPTMTHASFAPGPALVRQSGKSDHVVGRALAG